MDGFLTILILFIIISIYFLPTSIANKKRRKDRFFVFLVNLVIGWTILGWIGCLVWVEQDDE